MFFDSNADMERYFALRRKLLLAQQQRSIDQNGGRKDASVGRSPEVTALRRQLLEKMSQEHTAKCAAAAPSAGCWQDEERVHHDPEETTDTEQQHLSTAGSLLPTEQTIMLQNTALMEQHASHATTDAAHRVTAYLSQLALPGIQRQYTNKSQCTIGTRDTDFGDDEEDSIVGGADAEEDDDEDEADDDFDDDGAATAGSGATDSPSGQKSSGWSKKKKMWMQQQHRQQQQQRTSAISGDSRFYLAQQSPGTLGGGEGGAAAAKGYNSRSSVTGGGVKDGRRGGGNDDDDELYDLGASSLQVAARLPSYHFGLDPIVVKKDLQAVTCIVFGRSSRDASSRFGGTNSVPRSDDFGHTAVIGTKNGSVLLMTVPSSIGGSAGGGNASMTAAATTVVLSGHLDAITDAAWSDSAPGLFITVAMDSTAIVWDASKKVKVRQAALQHQPTVIRFLPQNNNYFVVGFSTSSTLRVFNLSTGMLVKKIKVKANVTTMSILVAQTAVLVGPPSNAGTTLPSSSGNLGASPASGSSTTTAMSPGTPMGAASPGLDTNMLPSSASPLVTGSLVFTGDEKGVLTIHWVDTVMSDSNNVVKLSWIDLKCRPMKPPTSIVVFPGTEEGRLSMTSTSNPRTIGTLSYCGHSVPMVVPLGQPVPLPTAGGGGRINKRRPTAIVVVNTSDEHIIILSCFCDVLTSLAMEASMVLLLRLPNAGTGSGVMSMLRSSACVDRGDTGVSFVCGSGCSGVFEDDLTSATATGLPPSTGSSAGGSGLQPASSSHVRIIRASVDAEGKSARADVIASLKCSTTNHSSTSSLSSPSIFSCCAWNASATALLCGTDDGTILVWRRLEIATGEDALAAPGGVGHKAAAGGPMGGSNASSSGASFESGASSLGSHSAAVSSLGR